MITLILSIAQATAVIAFLVAGACCFLLKQNLYGAINTGLFVVNLLIFYGARFIK